MPNTIMRIESATGRRFIEFVDLGSGDAELVNVEIVGAGSAFADELEESNSLNNTYQDRQSFKSCFFEKNQIKGIHQFLIAVAEDIATERLICISSQNGFDLEMTLKRRSELITGPTNNTLTVVLCHSTTRVEIVLLVDATVLDEANRQFRRWDR